MTSGWFLSAMLVGFCGGHHALVVFLVFACIAYEFELLGRKRAN